MTLLALLFSFSAMAQWCDLKDPKSGDVVYTYEGACGTQKFGGPWSDAVQSENKTKQKEVDDRKKDTAEKLKTKGERRKRLSEECAKAEGLVKELCDEVLDAR